MPNDFISIAYTDQTTDFRKDPNPVGDLRPTSNADEVNYVELRPGYCDKEPIDDNRE